MYRGHARVMPQRSATRRRLPGVSLGAVILVVCICTFMMFVMAGLATFQLSAAQKAQSNEQALHLAEGAIALATDAVHAAQKSGHPFGLNREHIRFVPHATSPGRYGEVTFDSGSTWGYSTNNFDGSNPTGWNSVVVPASSVHLVARGVAGNSVRLVETMLTVPPFPYALGVDGALQSDGPLIVKAEPSMAALVADPNLTSQMGANAGSNTSVAAAGGSFVSGDVVSTGPVTLGAPSTVLGVVRPGAISLPHIPITRYNNNGPWMPTLTGTVSGPLVLQNNTYVPGALTIGGDLQLAKSTLYVEGGPLIINGALKGNGAVFVHGDLIVNGGADLDASNLVAVLASGDVTVNGRPGVRKYFQGLVYTAGTFMASNITIAGAFISCTQPDCTSVHGSGIKLGPDTTVVYVPAATTMSSNGAGNLVGGPSASFYLAEKADRAAGSPDLATINPRTCMGHPIQYSGGAVPPPTSSIQMLAESSGLPRFPCHPDIFNAIMAEMGSNSAFQDVISRTGPYGPVIQANWCMLPGPGAFTTPRTPYAYAHCVVLAYKYDPASDRFIPIVPRRVTYYFTPPGSAGPPQPSTAAEFDATVAYTGHSSADIVAAMVAVQRIYMAAGNKLLTAGPTSLRTATVPDVQLNQFLSDPNPLRMVSWRSP